MKVNFDMHVHTEKSYDGRMSLEEAVRLAKERGMNGIAVCDHDEVMEAVPGFGDFVVIPGTEVSCKEGHLLGYFVTEKVTAKTVAEAAAQIKAQGGIAVLAHPFEHAGGQERFAEVALLMDHVDGIEVMNSRADRKVRGANRLAMSLAHTDTSTGKVFSVADINLAVAPEDRVSEPLPAAFAGSDAHLPEEVAACWMSFEWDGESADSLKEALRSSDNSKFVHGKRSRAVCTALSGYTARKRRGASIAGWCKWLAFYCKCAFEDIKYRRDRNILGQ